MNPVRAVMFFAPRPEQSCRWWAQHLGGSAEVHVEPGGFCWFGAGGVEVGFHPADPIRNPVGGSPVIYWAVEDVGATRAGLLAAGCTAHRGPLTVSGDRRICQLVDPFGNVFGLDGP